MADSETVDTTQQVNSNNPATKQKNPKRVAAGKAIIEKTRQARQAQKKALAEDQAIIANQALQEKGDLDPPTADPQIKNVLTTTQWLSVISIIISVVGIYYKREEIKTVFAQKSQPQRPTLPTVDFTPPPVKTQRKRRLQSME